MVIEKHFILKRDENGPDAAFTMEPKEVKKMIEDIINVEKALGKVIYELIEKQKKSKEIQGVYL